MKIACISAAEIPSTKANSIQVMKVCQALTQNGHGVILYAPGSGRVDTQLAKQHYGISEDFIITRVPSQKFLRLLDYSLQTVRLARKSAVDLVYTRVLWVARLAQLWKLPVILELHDLPAGRFAPRVFRQFLGSGEGSLIVFITHALLQQTEGLFGKFAPHVRTLVAPDGVDLARYENLPSPTEARKRIGIAERTCAAYSGGFYEGRGLDSVLDLAGYFPDVTFLLIGGTQQMVDLWKERAKHAGLENVIFTGFIQNAQLPLYQAAAEVLLMPYSQRVAGSSGGDISSVSSPMKMFEYMASGRIILASDLPVLHEVLDETNAVFTLVGDVQALRTKFSEVVTDLNAYRVLGEKARKDVQQYEWRSRMKRILDSFTF